MPLFHAFRHPWTAPAAALLLLASVAPVAVAERADRDKPMNAESDTLRYDDVNQLSVFKGNVVITKGTIVIRGAQVDVRQDAEGNQFGTVLASPDKLAFFRQKREGLNEFIEGEAKRIEYDGRTDVVKFIGQAVMRRYKGATLNDETNGGVITYDNKSDVFTVDGGPASSSPVNPSGRVRAMLTPKPRPETTGSGPGTGAATLKPSTGMEARP